MDALAVRSSTAKRIFDTLYTLDALNRLVGAEEGQLAGGVIEAGTRTRNELWNDLSPTGNWRNRRLDANGDGDFTDATDRDEPAANNTFTKANEWTARRVQKAGTGNYESYSYTHDAVGNLTAQQVDTYTNNVQTATGGRRFVYDAFGRLTRVEVLVGGLGEDRIAQYKFNGLGYRIMTQTDADFDGVFEDGERTYLMYDERWRVVASFVNASATPKEAFIYHAAGLAREHGQGARATG